jgi:hypothetical protein
VVYKTPTGTTISTVSAIGVADSQALRPPLQLLCWDLAQSKSFPKYCGSIRNSCISPAAAECLAVTWTAYGQKSRAFITYAQKRIERSQVRS